MVEETHDADFSKEFFGGGLVEFVLVDNLDGYLQCIYGWVDTVRLFHNDACVESSRVETCLCWRLSRDI